MAELITDGSFTVLMNIGGADLTFNPDSFDVQVSPLETRVPTIDGGSVRFGRYAGAGHPDRVDSYSFSPRWGMVDGALRQDLEELRAKGTFIGFAYWKVIAHFYTASAGGAAQKFYLPKKRKDAAVALSKTLADFPVKAWKDGVALTVVRKTTAQVTSGGAASGELWIADGYDDTGHVPMIVGTSLSIGDEIKIHYCPLFQVFAESVSVQFERVVENHEFRFVER